MTAGTADTPVLAVAEASTRSVILGIDASGRILQYDRNAGMVLPAGPAGLLAATLGDVVAAGQRAALAPILEAARTGREASAMLSINRAKGEACDAVVTVQPMCGGPPGLAALVIMRLAIPNEERFVDPAVMRRVLLDAPARIGATLDLDQMARGLMNSLVPHFCNSGGLLVLDSMVGDDEHPAEAVGGSQGSHPLRRMAVAFDDDDDRWDAAFPTGEVFCYPPGTPFVQCLRGGKPVCVVLSADDAVRIAVSWRRAPVADLLNGASMLLLPLIVHGVTFGLFVCTRNGEQRAFDPYDIEIGMEFASRAAILIDNARRYSRERATALALQRSMLPTGLSKPSSVEVHHRYLPGSRLIEVGGDWYESIALPGARVALVVGDVAGHGVRAAVTMGRLRTAIHTLAGLELAPAEALQRLDELMQTLGEREPHFATCAYAVYDATTGALEVASAGHLPPLLARPGAEAQFLDVPPAPPLGVGEGPIMSREFTLDDDTLLVLYTDGLVENRGRDIDDGLARLRPIFSTDASSRTLDDLGQATLDGAYSDHHRDDIALLIARLRRIPADDYARWELPAEPAAAGRARVLVRDRLEHWGLTELAAATELLASELVTNAVRHVGGHITLRLVRERTLLCEVADESDARPRMRHPGAAEETGRGLHVVGQLARRWGVRHTAAGKVVWCDQDLP